MWERRLPCKRSPWRPASRGTVRSFEGSEVGERSSWPRSEVLDWSVIYFVRHGSTGHIKIGYSGNVPARMQALARDHGPLDLLAVIEGTMTEERTHHARFAALRVIGEWFAPAAPLVDYVASLVSREPVGPVVVLWQTVEHEPLRVERDDGGPLPRWLVGTGGAVARGLPTAPPRGSRRE